MIDRRSPIQDYGRAFTVLAEMVDSASVLMGGLLALLVVQPGIPLSLVPNRYPVVEFMAVVIMLAVFNARGVYDSWRGRSAVRLLHSIAVSWGLTLLVVVALLATIRQLSNFPVEWLLWWGGISLVLMLLGRLLAFGFLRVARARGWNRKRVVIVGAGDLGRDMLHRVRTYRWTGFEVAAFFDDTPAIPDPSIEGVPLKTRLDDLDDYVSEHGIAEVWIALPLRAEERLQQVLAALRHSTANIRYVPDFFSYSLLNHAITNIAGRGMIDLSSSPMQGFNLLLKTVEDYVLGTLITLLISPVLAVLAIGVKLSSPGPVLFKQERHGWDGKPVLIYKFRSMKVHTEENGRVTQARRDDPRITRFGAFLRRTSLDELPQFFNVLEGKMSIVGPRPHAIIHGEYYKDIVDGYMKRHKVKPGITGWAQINGLRGETDTLEKMKQRIEYDTFYIENWSLWLDLKIIALTFLRGLSHRNAH